MLVLQFFSKGSDLPFAVLGINDDKLFAVGLDEEYFIDNWLADGIEGEDNVMYTPKDGVKFLEIVRDTLLEDMFENEAEIRGPEDVVEVPKVVDVDEESNDGETIIDPDLTNGGN